MVSLKATTLEWLRRSVSDSLAILSLNCSFTLADRLNMVSGCWGVTYRDWHRLGLFLVSSHHCASGQLSAGCSNLCCDLFHDVNKVVDLCVQLGTLQNHGLHLLYCRICIVICNKQYTQWLLIMHQEHDVSKVLIVKKDKNISTPPVVDGAGSCYC